MHALSGLRVLDVTQAMAGAYCSLLLADMGADVVKVERPPLGDDSRRMSTQEDLEASTAFAAMNRNKRAVALDLKSPEGADAFRRMVTHADVVVENFRPGVMDRLGLGYDALRALNPALVYACISGFGATGPARERGGFDLVAQAASGLMSVTGHPGEDPVKVGVPICDLNAGTFAALGVLAAVIHRRTTGAGQLVDVSLFEAGVASTVWESNEYFDTGRSPGPLGSAHRLVAPYQALRAADGHLVVGVGNQRLWERFCDTIGRPEMTHDERFATNARRLANREQLVAEIESTTEKDDVEHWVDLLESAGVPCQPINDMAAVHRDPQAAARGIVVQTEHPVLGTLRHLKTPIHFSDTPVHVARSAPLLGQHSREVLADAGFDHDQVARLLDCGAAVETQVPGEPTEAVSR